MIVLLVDDDAFFRCSIRALLEKGGLQVIEAVDGVEGLEITSANRKPDLFAAYRYQYAPDQWVFLGVIRNGTVSCDAGCDHDWPGFTSS